MKNSDKYFDFIKDDEIRNSVRKIADKVYYVQKNYVSAITEFFNPIVAEISMPIINNSEIQYKIFPSYEHCERKVFVFYPEFCEKLNVNELITGLRIFNKSKFKKLSHRDYLGSVMSLGIDRNKTGDIYIYEDYADMIIHSDISDYIMYSLEKIGNNKIELEKIPVDDVHFKEQEHIILNINSSSMRLDNIVKHLTNNSREAAAELIKSKNVKLNWQPEEKSSRNTEVGDMISISKYGRYKISKNMGITKSGKIKIEVKHYV